MLARSNTFTFIVRTRLKSSHKHVGIVALFPRPLFGA